MQFMDVLHRNFFIFKLSVSNKKTYLLKILKMIKKRNETKNEKSDRFQKRLTTLTVLYCTAVSCSKI